MNPDALRARRSFLEVWMEWKDRAARSLEKRGVAGTICLAAVTARRVLSRRWMYFRLENPWRRYLGERFDRRFGVDTAGILRLPELQSDPRFRHSKGYAPTPRSLFFHMLRQFHADYSKFVFIDIGCGKGKVVLLAVGLPFRQIIGIELSSQLIRIAEENLRSYRGKRKCNAVHLACADFSEFPIPEEHPTIYYLYDPFEAEGMHKVLENMRCSLAAAPRESYVLYLIPLHQDLLEESGFLTPIKQTHLYSIYKSS